MTRFLSLIVLLFIFISACNRTPVDPPEPELITTLTLTLTPDGGGDAVVLKFSDLDGDGGDAPIYSTEMLDATTTYNASLTFLNESVDPIEDITEEIKEEDLAHQVFYIADNIGMTIVYNDQDSNGKPLGLRSVITTGAAGNGTLRVVLRHEPEKNAVNVENGDITNAGGETDIDVTFDVTVQ